MADDAEAQEIHARITSVGTREEPVDDDQMAPSDVVGEPEDEDEEHVSGGDAADPDAVIVEDVTPARVSDDPDRDEDEDEDDASVEAAGETSAAVHPVDADADDDAHPDTVPAEAVLSEAVPPEAASAETMVPDTAAADEARDEEDHEPAAAYAMPAAAEAFPKHARPGDAIPESARPITPSGTDDSVENDDLIGDPGQLHERWAAIQSTFVDDPRGSVEAAAELISETINSLLTAAKERETGLRGEWDRADADTEVLRNALRNYRGLLDRLVAV